MKRKLKQINLPKLKFYNPITLENERIDPNTQLYIVQTEAGKYAIRGISDPFDHFRFDPHLCRAATSSLVSESIFAAPRDSIYATQYWPIKNTDLFLNNISTTHPDLYHRLFKSRLLNIDETFTEEEVTVLLQTPPTQSNAELFNPDANKINHEKWKLERLTEAAFFLWLASYFEDRINEDNIDDIELAYTMLQGTTKSTPLSQEYVDMLSPLNISSYTKSIIKEQLMSHELAKNTEDPAFIENLFSLTTEYPTHVQRYHLSTNFLKILTDKKQALEGLTQETVEEDRFDIQPT